MQIIILVFVVVYLFYLTSRISNLEKLLDDSGVKRRQILEQAHAEKAAQAAVQPQAAVATPAAKPQSQAATPAGWNPSFTQEDIFSTKTLTVVGVIALVFGVGFFFKLAIDRGWISEWGRIIIGLAVGALLIVLGDIWRERFGKFASAISGGGVAIIYLSFLLGNQLYGLYPDSVALGLLVLTTVISFFAGHRYKSEFLNYEALVGAYLGPLLIYISADHHAFLFAYLTIVNAAIIYAQVKRFAPTVLLLAGFGNAVNFAYWAVQFLNTENGFAAFAYLFATVFLFVLLGAALFHHSAAAQNEEQREHNADLFAVFTALLGIYVFGAAEILFSGSLEAFRAPFQLCAGFIYMIAYVFVDRLERKSLNYTLTALAALSLLLSAYHQFNDNHIQTVLFVAIGLFAVACARVFKRADLAAMGTIVLFAGLFKSFVDPYPVDSQFLINSKFLVMLLAGGALVLANLTVKDYPDEEFQDVGMAAVAIAGISIWLAVTADLFHYNIMPTQLLFSVWSLVFAVVLIAAGAYGPWRVLRKIAIGLFVFSIFKAFLYDSTALDIAYRVVSFITLGVILLSTSFYYQKHKEQVKEFLK